MGTVTLYMVDVRRCGMGVAYHILPKRHAVAVDFVMITGSPALFSSMVTGSFSTESPAVTLVAGLRSYGAYWSDHPS